MRTQDLFDLSGKVAIVTGGATGLGRQMADALADLGASLVLCARNGERCEDAAAEFEAAGTRAIGLSCDVRERSEVEAVVARTIQEFGGVDVLVNNAGTSWGARAEEISIDAWEKVVGVNLTGTFHFCQTVGASMIERGRGGCIVNIASVAAFRGAHPDAMNAVAYNASKGAVVALSRDLAVKWAQHGVRVNALAPGWFPTAMAGELLEGTSGELLLSQIPMGRFGGPDDLKGALAFLASRASGFVTGQVVVVDGGQLAFG